MKYSSVRLLQLILVTSLIAFGVNILAHAGLISGGTPGLSLLANQMLPWGLGFWFAVINLPFLILGWRQFGLAFIQKSLLSILLLSLQSQLMSQYLHLILPPWIAAVMAGAFIGVGLSMLFALKASLGGFNVLALYAQARWSIVPERSLRILDSSVMLLALSVVPATLVLTSMVTVVVMSLTMSGWRRGGVNLRLQQLLGALS